VIVVSWNVKELLLGCLRALADERVRDDLALEVLVVDNASSDGSAEAARSLPGVRVIETGRNLGYGRANNLGFEQATGRHFLVLNPDTVPQPGSLRALFDFVGAHHRAGLVSPRLLNPDGTPQEAAFRFPTVWMALLDLFPPPRIIPGRVRRWLLSSPINGRYSQERRAHKPYQIDHPLGACMLVNRAAYCETGGFDAAIAMYSEEVDLALRLEATGWESWQVPNAEVIHYGGRSTGQLPDRMFVELWRSRLYIYRKHYTRASYIALGALLAASQALVALRALVQRRTGRIGREEAHRRWQRAGAVLRHIWSR
jgi:hypothetical protein